MVAPNLAPVEELIGTWRGDGTGGYPTIEPFEYTDEVRFADIGKPFLVYTQRTWNRDGQTMHVESGYLRVSGPGVVELVLALPTGQTELGDGTVGVEDESLIIDVPTRLDNTPAAKRVLAGHRVWRLRGDELESTFEMEREGIPLTRHLGSRLRRVPDQGAD